MIPPAGTTNRRKLGRSHLRQLHVQYVIPSSKKQGMHAVRRYNSDSRPPGAHGNVNAAQNLQGISIPRFSSDVVRRLYVEYWHLDADRGAAMADLSPEPLGIFAGTGPISRRHSHLPVLADWRRGGRPHGATEDPAGLAIRADGECRGAHAAGGGRVGTRVAHLVSVVRLRVGASVWRAGVPGADSNAG